MNEFLNDVWSGLNKEQKSLQSKYFYNATGDELFREIMACPEYYLTRCEQEIFSGSCNDIAADITRTLSSFDLVELGPGDATKSVYLLDALVKRDACFTYVPIDISENVINQLQLNLPARFPGMKIQGLNGDYFRMLDKMKTAASRSKLVLFMGSTIGNVPFAETVGFLKELRSHLNPGDLVLIGFDLKKDAGLVLAAYNDAGGITRRFNLNLLQRINDTFNANFDLSLFEHKPEYDPQTGACKSYLVSIRDQAVHIGATGTVQFAIGERIFMEISQKYTVAQTDELAAASGFTPMQHFFDSKKWFLDALWQCI